MTVTITKTQINDLLTTMRPGDTIELSPTGEFILDQHQTKAEIIAAEFGHLQGQGVSVSDASEKYSSGELTISTQILSKWVKSGYIKVLEDDGYRVILNEADVAYCAKIYREKFIQFNGKMAGRRIFDKNGNPYRRKFPELAERRRRQRHAQKRNGD